MPLRVDASRPLTQGEGARWHCAARREIAERSEEAPEAKAAQPSCNVGSWKTPTGCFGGDARGAEKGAQPHNRPRLAPAGGGPNNIKQKASVPAGHKSHLSKDRPRFIFFRALAALAPPRSNPAGGGPSNRKRKAPVPAGHKSHLSEDKPCFYSL